MSSAMLALVLVLAPGVSAQRRVAVRVVDVSGGQAYVEPGEDAGLHRGDAISIGRRRFEVVGVTSSYAVVAIDNAAVSVGDRGTASARGTEEAVAEVPRLAAPTPLAEFRGRWPDAERPADSQRPDYVPLGVTDEDRRLLLTFSAGGRVIVPLGDEGDVLGRSEVRARVRAQPFEAIPISFDADAAFQLWFAEDWSRHGGADEQPIVRVRALELAYGERGEFYAALGRLRYASATVGQLDGLRVESPELAGFSAAAFGGFIPDPLSGLPSFDGARFGAELGYAPESDLKPVARVTAHGSLFEGELDERRLGLSYAMYPGESRVGAYAELGLFDADNPWLASAFELVALGADTSVRVGPLELGARLDVRAPERSRWLDAFLGTGDACVASNAASDPAGTCAAAYGFRYQGSIDAGLELDDVALHAGAHAAGLGDFGEGLFYGGYAQVRVADIAGALRIEVTADANTGTFSTSYGVRAGLGLTLFDEKLDVAAYYRPSLLEYASEQTFLLEHGLGLTLLVTPVVELDVTASVDAYVGGDAGALIGALGVVWRPRVL